MFISTPAVQWSTVSFKQIQNNNIVILVRKVTDDITHANIPSLDFQKIQ